MNELPLDLIRGSNSLADLAGRIVEAHAKADGAMRSAVANAVIAGELLIEAKRQVPHGQWLPGCARPAPERTAQAYMRLARKLPELEPAKAQRVADLIFGKLPRQLRHHRSCRPFPSHRRRSHQSS